MATMPLDLTAERKPPMPDFAAVVARHGFGTLTRSAVTTLRVNVGKLCNQACDHCHVEAGPTRSEIMTEHIADRIIELLAASPRVETLDLTGQTESHMCLLVNHFNPAAVGGLMCRSLVIVGQQRLLCGLRNATKIEQRDAGLQQRNGRPRCSIRESAGGHT
ncbi:MAG: hypothetical protein AB1714_08945 [Acidobacteriota bacterium]